jgi:hypothetical protein
MDEQLATNKFSQLWLQAKLLTPDWVKDSATVAVGVLGGLALFQMLKTRVRRI